MNSTSSPGEFSESVESDSSTYSTNQYSVDIGLQRVVDRLSRTLARDALVQTTVESLREQFQVDRVLLYYFYRCWKGQVTFESCSKGTLSIFGSTGADDCFNAEYADLYLKGRVHAVANIETASIDPCHLEFLREIKIKANLVAPILTPKGLWGLLIAHHCKAPHLWSETEINAIRAAANHLATAPAIRDS
ncbi:MAG: GAF domain-containing protein [Leptolyngbyaceae cyanobacterium MO_188.B28]|nr:GAF domain-containing protein [Leptolyngbyaceae cyanobacterium MO_188.B28]